VTGETPAFPPPRFSVETFPPLGGRDLFPFYFVFFRERDLSSLPIPRQARFLFRPMIGFWWTGPPYVPLSFPLPGFFQLFPFSPSSFIWSPFRAPSSSFSRFHQKTLDARGKHIFSFSSLLFSPRVFFFGGHRFQRR